jgi:PAS domain S-box-containing protein
MTKAGENTPTVIGLADLPTGAYCCNREGLISYYNARAVELWGREPRLLDPQDRYCGSSRVWRTNGKPLPLDDTPMARVLREGVTVHNEHIVIERPDGTRLLVNVNISPTLDADGAISGAINIFSQVEPFTPAIAAEGPSQGLNQLMDALGVAVYTTDAQGRILTFNQRAVELWGRTPEIGRDLWCGSWRIFTLDGEPLPLENCPMAVALHEGRSVRDVEIVVERPDGTRVNVLPLPTPLRNERGELTGAVNVLVDVTDRSRAEEKAHHLAAIVESSNDAVISKGLDGRIMTWNAAAERLFGYRASEAIGQSINLIVPEDLHDEDRDIIDKIRRGERIVDLETHRRHRSGNLVPVSLTVSPMRSAIGQIIAASTIAREIGSRKAAEDALRHALTVKDEYIGLISHELKNPITVILGYARILHRNENLLTPEDRHESFQAIAAEAEKLRDNIDHLLMISRLETRAPELVPILLSKLVPDVIQHFKDNHQRNVVLEVDDDAATALGDETLFSIVLQNLLTNADKYSPHTEDITVHINREEQGMVTVHVQDRGIGLSDDDMERLFTPFYRSPQAQEQASGLGLGLTVCLRAVEAMGGKVTATGKRGEGSDFSFCLPTHRS